jgi:hypothetical protein
MKSSLLAVIILCAFTKLSAQNTFTRDYCTEFVHQQLNEFNIKLHNAITTGKVKAYKNDSLTTEWTTADLETYLSPTFEVMVPNPDNPDDPYDLVGREVKYNFTPESDFKGISISYQKEVEDYKISFEARSIAPLVSIVWEHGLDFDPYPVAWVKMKDLKRVFSKQELHFYRSIIAARSTMGDFVNTNLYPCGENIYLWNDISAQTIYNVPYWQYINERVDTILGTHYAELLKYAATKYIEQNGTFYKDVELQNAYDYVVFDLAVKVSVMVPNPDNPDDPYDLIVLEVAENFDFFQVNEIAFHKTKKGIIVQMKTDQEVGGESLYFSYSKVKMYIPEYDRIVLDELIKSLTK